MFSRLLGAAGAAILLAGCQSDPLPQAGSLDAGFGEVSRYNAAVQIINPDPVYPEGGAQPGDNGEKGANAVKAYRKGETKELKVQSTSNTATGGGPQ